MLTFPLKRLTTPFLFVIFALLGGCGESSSGSVSAESGSPEHAATMFFYAIYDKDKNLDKVAKYATPKQARIIKSFGTTRAVARNLLNMQFDTVEIEVDKGRNLRESYGKTATITLIFTGMLHGNKKTDLRTVKMVKRNGNWLVEKIKDDPYAR
jgi:hypothetical protein